MKQQPHPTPQPDKATPRPWQHDDYPRIGHEGHFVANCNWSNEREADAEEMANAALIVTAVNSHAAYVELEAAAKALLFNLENTTGWNMPFKSKTADGGQCSSGGEWVKNQGGNVVRSALAKLAAIRNGGGK